MREGQDILAPTNEFPNRRFKLKRKVGQGACGFVFFATCQFYGDLSNKDVALRFSHLAEVKELEFQFLKTLIDYQNSQNEEMFPTNMIKVYDIFEYREYLITVMEKGEVDLYTHLTENNNHNRHTITLKEKYQICLDVVLPIYFLHSNKIIHRDIKPENYLKVGNKFKLIDFGLIRNKNDLFMTKNVGTGLFQAPELINNSQNYDERIDVWALGCAFYEIFEDQPIFNGNSFQQVRNQILNIGVGNNVNVIINKINQLDSDAWFKQLMIKMLQPDFKQRINAAEVLIDFKKNVIIDKNYIVSTPLNKQMNESSQLQKQFNSSVQANQQVHQEKEQLQNKLSNELIQMKLLSNLVNQLASELEKLSDENRQKIFDENQDAFKKLYGFKNTNQVEDY